MINPNPHLSIVIPTFNRADILDYCLGEHIILARENSIQIFVFDNASLDATEAIVKKRMQEYPLIEYHRHETNVGPDANFEFALKKPKTDYVWLLGDSYLMPVNGIDYILELISIDKKEYDMILFNIDDLVVNIPTKDYKDRNNLLRDLFWLTNCMSCLIFNNQLIASADFARYRNTYFIQTGIIFEYISNKEFKIHWSKGVSLKLWSDFGGIKKIGWQSNIFEIWFKNRTNFIFSLPASYDIEVKLKLAMETYIHSRVSMANLLSYRASGVLNYESYKKYKYLFPITMPHWGVIILFFSIIPRFIPKLLRKLKKFFFNFFSCPRMRPSTHNRN